ncbi:MAG: DNA helicase RecQ [Alphaproteobacteria bacterium]|nr:DNA helicase RecQ [Alphaproteobacteria bacterium]
MSDTQPSIDSVLSGIFGFRAFRPGQDEVIQTIVDGRHCLAVMPTGSGKSLCYQVPALVFARPTVIISPLKALIGDQVAGLAEFGVAAARVHSGLDRAEQVSEWRKFKSGESKLLYLSPERLMTDRMLDALKSVDPALFVIDEAHCISKWGASFRPAYEQLSQLVELFPNAVIAAFTATADRATRTDIAEKLFRGRGRIIVRGFDRPNLTLSVSVKANWEKQLLDFLAERKGQSGIVYCLSRKSTEEVAQFLSAEGFTAIAYHAGQDSGQRRASQDRFMSEDGVVMVATIAFGMGVDKPDIRFVAHVNLPGSMEEYYQEIGRAGRDGAPAETLLLYGLEDMGLRRQFIIKNGGDDAHQIREHKRLDALLAYCEAATCRRVALLSYFEEASSPCGNCDNCIDPPVTQDATTLAQFAFETILKTGQAFGAGHIADILRGADTAKIRERHHERLATYGAGKGRSRDAWLSLLRQAVAAGFVVADIQKYGGLALTARGRAVLDGGATFTMREDGKARGKKKKASTPPAAVFDDATVHDLLTRLKATRLSLARGRGVPAYLIFPDATLLDMARVRPRTLYDMATVSGVGPRKLAQFGKVFLEAIAEWGARVG